jgi:prepilin-type processing-associated H-X9-DG protein
MSNIGKGLAVYMADNNDRFPWLISDNKWDASTGASQTISPGADTTYNVSTLLFVLIRDNQPPGIFICPSTSDAPDSNTKTSAGQNWDFSPFRIGGWEHVSYSYQAPMLDKKGRWGSGINADSNNDLVILADRTPAYDGKNAQFDWTNPGKAETKTGMSQNHTGGEIINVLYADLHVADVKQADAGIRNDNIYSCAGSAGEETAPETSQGPGTLDITKHSSPKDSFLLGPKKLP